MTTTPFEPPTPDEGLLAAPEVAVPALAPSEEGPSAPRSPWSRVAPAVPAPPVPPVDTSAAPATASVAPSRPETAGIIYRHTPGDDATTVLAPVTAATNILDRIPLSERKRWRLISGVAAGFAVLSAGFAIFLWVVNVHWQDRSDQLTDEAYSLGQRLADARDQVLAEQQQIDLLAEQLKTSQARVIELADATALAGDAAASAEQRIAFAEELSALGGAVSLSLNRCVNEQHALVGFLKNPSAWDAADLAARESSVNAICAAAQSANATLQRELTG